MISKKLYKILQVAAFAFTSLAAFFLPLWMSFIPQKAQAFDLVTEIIDPARDHGTIIDSWETPTAVWSRIFRGSINVFDWDNWFWRNDPLIVKITKLILNTVVALWVTALMIVWILYVLARGDSKKQEKLIWWIWNIVIWILIALASNVIIILIRSVSQSSLTF